MPRLTIHLVSIVFRIMFLAALSRLLSGSVPVAIVGVAVYMWIDVELVNQISFVIVKRLQVA